jgi:hypothetical protein
MGASEYTPSASRHFVRAVRRGYASTNPVAMLDASQGPDCRYVLAMTTPSDKKPDWAGKSGPWYEFDEEGDLVWFVSPSSMAKGVFAYSPPPPKPPNPS